MTAYRAAGSSGGSADWAENVSGTLRNYRIPPAVDLARLIARLQVYVTRYQQYLPDHAPGTSLDDPLKRIADATAAMAQAAGEALAVLGEQPGPSQQPPGTRHQAIALAAPAACRARPAGVSRGPRLQRNAAAAARARPPRPIARGHSCRAPPHDPGREGAMTLRQCGGPARKTPQPPRISGGAGDHIPGRP